MALPLLEEEGVTQRGWSEAESEIWGLEVLFVTPRGREEAVSVRRMACRSQEQSLREELTCAICCDLFQDPVMLECMHHFCRECIQGYWSRCPRVVSCPQCRREFPNQAFRPHYLVSGVVEKVRQCSSEECRRKMHKQFEDALLSQQREMENFVRMKHVAEQNICSLTKISTELHSKIQAEFGRLHQILEQEERAVLIELAKEEEQLVVRLQGDIMQLEQGIFEMKKGMEHTQQSLSKMADSLLLEVESMAVRPAVHVEVSPTLNLEHLRDRYDGPLQYIFWRRMLRSVHPAPASLTFDPESAHPNLILSKDLTAVTESSRPRPVHQSSRRFQQCVNVLASETFRSGRHYWEVWVGNKTKWDLGVAAESVDRAAKIKLCPENGYWTLRLRNRTDYWAVATPWVCLTPQTPLRKVGVLLNCEEQRVAFYNAENMFHLFTFHQATAHSFCPFFSTCFSDDKQNEEPLRICHLAL
uniref:Zinc-binding protein A33-like n=1 Tax=Sphenodon punctatus TaxID=8508 RepID=A0A8D0GYU1_SPHPU